LYRPCSKHQSGLAATLTWNAGGTLEQNKLQLATCRLLYNKWLIIQFVGAR